MKQEGLTLIETMMALAILLIILSGILPGFITYARLNTDSELRSDSVAIAQQVMEELRHSEFSQWPESEESWSPISMGGRDFVVNIHSDWAPDTVGAKEVRVRISYENRVLYEVKTIFTQLH